MAVVELGAEGWPLSDGPAPTFDDAAVAEAFRQTRAEPDRFELVPVRRFVGELPAPWVWFEGESCLWWDGSEGRGIVGPWIRRRRSIPGLDPNPYRVPEGAERGLYGEPPAAIAYRVVGAQPEWVERALLRWRADRIGRPLDGTRPMPGSAVYAPPYPPPGAWVITGAPHPDGQDRPDGPDGGPGGVVG